MNLGEFAGNLGDLMVVTLSNILHVPIVLFTTITNLPVVCITPVSDIETAVPLYLAYSHMCPGHYDYVTTIDQQSISDKDNTLLKCYCGRKSNFKGSACSTDVLGHCRCSCARRSKPCTHACKCKDCSNKYGTRPPPSMTRTRASYEAQSQPLCGRAGSEFLHSINEQETIGHMTLFEGILTAIMVWFMLFGININERLYQAYCEVIHTANLCSSFIELPLFKRSKQYIVRYVQWIPKIVELFLKLMK